MIGRSRIFIKVLSAELSKLFQFAKKTGIDWNRTTGLCGINKGFLATWKKTDPSKKIGYEKVSRQKQTDMRSPE